MPTPTPAPGSRLTRRAVLTALAGVAGATLVGCTTEQPARPGTRPHPVVASVDPDVTVAAEALASQRQQLELLEATRRRHGDLSTELDAVVTTHEAHADLLADAVPKGVSASPSAAPHGRASGRMVVPRSRARALAAVVEAEQQLATATKRQAFRAESGAFARLLASMAAAAAQHATVLATSAESGSPS